MRLIALTLCLLLCFAPVSAQSTDTPDEARTIAALEEGDKVQPPLPHAPLTHIGEMQIYTAAYEDTFIKLAREKGLGYVELRAANPDMDPWMPPEKAQITLPTMHLIPDAPQKGIIINLPEMRLYYFPAEGEPQSHAIGIGREGLLTPTGTTYVREKTEDPVWRPTKRMRAEDPRLPAAVAPGTENPLGSHILYLGWPEYGIHGTNKPYGIGRRVSSGCIRMYPEGIVELYSSVPVGTQVTVVDQPVKTAWIGNALYLEAHPTMGQADIMEVEGILPGYQLSRAEMRTILEAAAENRDLLDWETIRDAVRERRGYPVVIARKPQPSGLPVDAGAAEDEFNLEKKDEAS